MGEHSNHRWTAAADQALLDLVTAGVDWTMIAETLNRGYHAVKARAGKLRRPGARAEGESEVRDII
jgi:hypothetical protein